MHGNWISLLLPIFFIIHNIEEIRNCRDHQVPYPSLLPKSFRKNSIFKLAIGILSLIVILVICSNFFIENVTLETFSVLIFVGIFINAVQHILLFLGCRRSSPGIYSAVL